MSSMGIAELFVLVSIWIIGALVVVWPACRICRRVGFSPWLGLLSVVPLANLVLLWYVAFSPWPEDPR